jgi:hypothetical protein
LIPFRLRSVKLAPVVCGHVSLVWCGNAAVAREDGLRRLRRCIAIGCKDLVMISIYEMAAWVS